VWIYERISQTSQAVQTAGGTRKGAGESQGMNPWQHPALNSEHWLYFSLGFMAATAVWLILVIGIGIGLWCRRDKGAGAREAAKDELSNSL
jgi:hypothetical protein